MTLDTMAEAEIVDAGLSAGAARALTDRIKIGVEAVWALVTQAYTERAWSALGYRSWDDYCTREFGTSRIRLPREERAEVVASLRESGLSLRAIAAATGYSEPTVRRELAGASNDAPDAPSLITGTDGKSYPPKPQPAPKPAEAQCIHCGNTMPITQLYEGGQGYECDPCVNPNDVPAPAPALPAPPRRRPISDIAGALSLDVHRITQRINGLAEDDRLPRDRAEAAARLTHYLDQLESAVINLRKQLNANRWAL